MPANIPTELKVGQSEAEVQQILGPPKSRGELGSLVFYLYPQFKVVFQDGMVATPLPKDPA